MASLSVMFKKCANCSLLGKSLSEVCVGFRSSEGNGACWSKRTLRFCHDLAKWPTSGFKGRVIGAGLGRLGSQTFRGSNDFEPESLYMLVL